MKKTALICGISGQDGSWLAKLLLEKGYDVWGTSRDAQGHMFPNLLKLGIRHDVKLLSMIPEDFRSVFVAIKQAKPDEVYFLAGQSSVGLSFEQPAETIQSITLGTLNMLENCRLIDHPIRFYHAGSSECFGDTQGQPATEKTAFKPCSPYAVAKSSAFWLVSNYREAYGLYACSGILYNHESTLRPERFVTQKIIKSAQRIANGSSEKLSLGRLDISRDWGWAPEYVKAMWLMLQQEKPDDYIVATGHTFSLESFVQESFDFFDLDWRKHVIQDTNLYRPNELLVSYGDPRKAKEILGWKAKTKMPQLIQKIIGENP